MVQLRGIHAVLKELGISPRPGIRQIHLASSFGKNEPDHDTYFIFDPDGRLTGYKALYKGKPELAYSWTYGNDSIPVHATRIVSIDPEREHTQWLFDATGRVGNIVYLDTLGDTVKTVSLLYDDCLSLARIEDFSPGAGYRKIEETMDCQGNFRKIALDAQDSVVFRDETFFGKETAIHEYLIFPPELPPIQQVRSKGRLFGKRTIIKIYSGSIPVQKSLLKEKIVQNASGQWIKWKFYKPGTGMKSPAAKRRCRYNDDGLPEKQVMYGNAGPLRMKIVIRFSYEMAQ